MKTITEVLKDIDKIPEDWYNKRRVKILAQDVYKNGEEFGKNFLLKSDIENILYHAAVILMHKPGLFSNRKLESDNIKYILEHWNDE